MRIIGEFFSPTTSIGMVTVIILVWLLFQGLALLEAGYSDSSPTSTSLKRNFLKNNLIFVLGWLSYEMAGIYLMYPGELWLINKRLGAFTTLGLHPDFFTASTTSTAASHEGNLGWSLLTFQGMVAVLTALIATMGLAERGRLVSMLCFGIFCTGLLYPVLGSWYWGGGWLAELGFHDFAGATFIHSVAGWAGLAGILIVGARTGKYTFPTFLTHPTHSNAEHASASTHKTRVSQSIVPQEASSNPQKLTPQAPNAQETATRTAFPPILTASHIYFMTIGGFIVLLTWIGLQVGLATSAQTGYQTGLQGDAYQKLPLSPLLLSPPFSLLFIQTHLSGLAGLIGAALTSGIILKKIHLSMVIRGLLGGLVAVSGSLDTLAVLPLLTMLTTLSLIAFSGGIIVVLASVGLDKVLKIDDPVGIVSIHLACGVWGTLAGGLFSDELSVLTQFVGIAAYAVGTFLPALIVFTIIEAVWLGLRNNPL